jgi:hypothetical protein
MEDYMTAMDIPLLADYGFAPGQSGASWFGTDKTGECWQTYVVEDDTRLTFVGTRDRTSIYMKRSKFEEMFSG